MTSSTGTREFCLSYADRELAVLMGLRGADEWFREGMRFVAATGIYDNFTVAGGQNTAAWVTAPRARVMKAAEGVLRAACRESEQLRKRKAAWHEKMEPLVAFLRAARSRTVRIRHHYAWN
jgi:hypothetical protein